MLGTQRAHVIFKMLSWWCVQMLNGNSRNITLLALSHQNKNHVGLLCVFKNIAFNHFLNDICCGFLKHTNNKEFLKSPLSSSSTPSMKKK